MLNSEDMNLIMAVVETGTMHAASDRAHISQPAISRRIQALERQIKVKLFERTGRRLLLTKAGEEFVRRSRDITNRIDDLELEMAAFGSGQRGVLRIGATAIACRYLLAPALEEMRRRYPEYELYLVNETSRQMPDLVRRGLVDVGIASVTGPLSGLSLCPWKKLHLGILSLQPARGDAVSIGSLEASPLVISSSGSLRSLVEEALRLHGVTPRVVAQADSLEVIRVLVRCGFGKAIVPMEVMEEDAALDHLSLSPLMEPVEVLQVGCFFSRTHAPLRAFLGLLNVDLQAA